METELRQEQFELFDNSRKESEGRRFSRLNSFISVTVSLENIILLVIFCLMLVVLSFSLGVEKGRRSFSSQAPVSLAAVKPQIVQPPVSVKVLPVQKTIQPQLKNNATFPLVDKQAKDLGGVKKFTVQIATLQKQSSVQAEVNRLKKLGFDSWVIPGAKSNTLCVGRFATKKEAEVMQKSLQKMYDDCFIRRI